MCDRCNWEDFLSKIDELLDSGDAEWARDTLEGIRENVEHREHFTPGQHRAFENIQSAVERQHERGRR